MCLANKGGKKTQNYISIVNIAKKSITKAFFGA